MENKKKKPQALHLAYFDLNLGLACSRTATLIDTTDSWSLNLCLSLTRRIIGVWAAVSLFDAAGVWSFSAWISSDTTVLLESQGVPTRLLPVSRFNLATFFGGLFGFFLLWNDTSDSTDWRNTRCVFPDVSLSLCLCSQNSTGQHKLHHCC